MLKTYKPKLSNKPYTTKIHALTQEELDYHGHENMFSGVWMLNHHKVEEVSYDLYGLA